MREKTCKNEQVAQLRIKKEGTHTFPRQILCKKQVKTRKKTGKLECFLGFWGCFKEFFRLFLG